MTVPLIGGRSVALYARLAADDRFIIASPPELDIVTRSVRVAGARGDASSLARRIFDEVARRDLHLAVAEFPIALVDLPEDMTIDRDTVTCLRSVLMKPDHLDWIESAWDRLDSATDAVRTAS